MKTALIASLITLVPIFELRGGIPYALAKGLPLVPTYFLCVLVNALVGPLVFLFLTTVHRWLLHVALYERIVGRLLDRARTKVESKVGRYGYLGLVLFVAVPLPVTGAYTGALGAWVLGLDPKKTYLAVALGVCIAGIVVSLVSFLGIGALSFFTKEVSA